MVGCRHGMEAGVHVLDSPVGCSLRGENHGSDTREIVLNTQVNSVGHIAVERCLEGLRHSKLSCQHDNQDTNPLACGSSRTNRLDTGDIAS